MLETIMGSRSTCRVIILCAGTLSLAPVSTGQVNLSLEPASVSVAPGGAFEVQLWARSDSPRSFDGADVVLQWDPAVATLVGQSDDGAPYAWDVSAFPPASHRNDTWADGDATYQCYALPGRPAPETDLLITTFQFTASQSAGTTTVRVPIGTGSETEIGSAGVSVLGTTSAATITVGSGGGDGSGGGGTSGGSGDGTGGSDGSDANHPPAAIASATPLTGVAPLTVNFDGGGSSDPDAGDSVDYRWDFGDGAGATGATATHTYPNVGNYDAVLTVTDSHGASVTAEAKIEVTSENGGGVDASNPADDTSQSGDTGNADVGQGAGAGAGAGAGEDTPAAPGFVSLCGAGVIEGMLFCAVGLFLAGRVRRGGWRESAWPAAADLGPRDSSSRRRLGNGLE
jgi:PKD repeat protein